MAGRRSSSLVLELAADVSKLTPSVRVARAALLDLQQGAESVEAAVRQSFNDMMPVDSARRAEREFDRIFKSIRANARAVLAEGDGKTALQLFDVGAADEQVRALTANAAQLRQWSGAAEAASLEGGEFAERQRQIAVALQAQAVELEQQALTLDETASAFRAIQAQIGPADAAMARSTQVTAAKRAGLQQLSFQLNDVAVQFAAGTPPMTIFAQQGGQVVQALQLMSGESKGLLGFLGGPWGIALTSATVVLAPFVAKLWESADAAEAAELATDALGQAQSVLGRMFDLTTGKIENQNQMLRINALLTARNLEMEARTKRVSARETLVAAQQGGAAGFFEAQTLGISGLGPTTGERNAAAVSNLLRSIRSSANPGGTITREEAIRRAETMDFSGTRVTRDQFIAALRDAEWANENDRIARDIRTALDTGVLPESLRKKDTSSDRTKKDKTAEEALRRARAFEDELSQAQAGILEQLLARARNEDERLAIQLGLLFLDRQEHEREIDRAVADGDLTKAQAERLKLLARNNALLEEERLKRETQQRLLDQQLELDREALSNRMAELQFQMAFATSREERKAIAAQIMQRQLDERRLAANRLVASDDQADRDLGEAQLRNIAEEERRGYALIDREFADPIESLIQHLEQSVGDLDDAFLNVAAHGLEALEDGLVGVLSGTESVAKAFKKMANQIIADLVRIAVQKLILNSLTGGFFGFLGLSEGGAVERKADGGYITGPGTSTSDSIPALLSNGEFVINAAATARFRPVLEAINSGRVPAFASGGPVRLAQLPPLERLQASWRSPAAVEQHFHVDARGAVLAEQLVSEMQRVGAIAAVGGSRMAEQSLAEQSFSTIP